jgi:DHA1 family bicyclomycin/chloramphenicol resistance-like MFS transporter
MALLTSIVALSIDAMLPALGFIADDLQINNIQHTHLIVSLFFAGMALGQLFYGPLADDKGRRYAILHGLLIFVLGTAVCMFSNSLEVMLVGRLIQAFGVSGPKVATVALIRDKYQGDAMARVMSFVMMVFILVPMLAPAFGQLILTWFSWRIIFLSFVVIALGLGLWFYVRQDETLMPQHRIAFSWSQLWQSSLLILTNKLVVFYTLSAGIIFGAFLAYISASQTIFQQIYDTGRQFALYFALLSFAIGIASFTNGTLVMRLGMRTLCTWAMLGWLAVSTVLVGLCLLYQGVPPLWQLVTALFCGFFCIGIILGNINAMAMLPLGEVAGLGAAIIGSLSSVVAVLTAVIVGHFVYSTITPIALGFVGFGALSLLLYWFAEPNSS